MIRKLILKTICITSFMFFWILFPAGLLAMWIVEKESISLDFQWECYWEAFTDAWNDKL